MYISANMASCVDVNSLLLISPGIGLKGEIEPVFVTWMRRFKVSIDSRETVL